MGEETQDLLLLLLCFVIWEIEPWAFFEHARQVLLGYFPRLVFVFVWEGDFM